MIKISLIYLMLLGSLQAIAQRDPMASFGTLKRVQGNQYLHEATLSALLSAPSVTVDHDSFKIISYEVTVQPNTGDIIGPYKVQGAELSPKIKDILRNHARNSGVIYMDEIRVQGPDRRVRNVNSITIRYTK